MDYQVRALSRRAGHQLMPRIAWFMLPFAAASVCLSSTGCSSGGGNSSNSLVKSINAYVPPDGEPVSGGAITLYAGASFLTGNITEFGQVSNNGGYISLASGTYNLVMSGPTLQPSVQLAGVALTGNNTEYTVIGAGEAGQTGALAPQIIVAPNFTRNQLVLTTGTAAIRVINVSLDPNNLGLYSTNNGGAPTTALAPATASLPFGYSSSNNVYDAVPTSTIAQLAIVDVTATGAKLGLSGGSNLNTKVFVPGDAYSLIIYGQPGNGTYPLGCTWIQDYP